MLETLPAHVITWLAILFCITQSAMFSGLNLALFGVSRLQLEVESSTGNRAAVKILKLRSDSNFLLTTILWGNVAVNVLLALLSDSVLAGIGAFVFSTVVITFFGEIMPQAYFSRNALRMGALLAPVLKLYQVLLYPVAKPSATMLDWWLGKEGIQYFRERELRIMLKKHIEAAESDVDRLEGVGALNFLALDDLLVSQEGEPVDPQSIIPLPIQAGRPVFPAFERTTDDPFLKQINLSGKKWVIITDADNQPKLVLNANAFLRAAFLDEGEVNAYAYCHRPIIFSRSDILLGKVLSQLKVYPEAAADDVIDDDLVLVWGNDKRVITGADILGRLLRGITIRQKTE